MKLINADKVEKFLKLAYKTAYLKHNSQVKDGAELVMEYIRELDTIDPESLKDHARWEINPDGYYPYCSKCNEEPKNGVMSNYCPNCGAKMDLGGK